MRIAELAVVDHDHRLMPLEPNATIRVSAALAIRSRTAYRALRLRCQDTAIDCDGVPDTTGHTGSHPIAEAWSDPSGVVQPPILEQIAIDGDRLAFLDDQRAGKAAPELLHVAACG
jgi:hypothetical protein